MDGEFWLVLVKLGIRQRLMSNVLQRMSNVLQRISNVLQRISNVQQGMSNVQGSVEPGIFAFPSRFHIYFQFQQLHKPQLVFLSVAKDPEGMSNVQQGMSNVQVGVEPGVFAWSPGYQSKSDCQVKRSIPSNSAKISSNP